MKACQYYLHDNYFHRIMTSPSSIKSITDLSMPALRSEIENIGESSFRAKQIIKWLYQERVNSFDDMNNLSKILRQKLAASFTLEKLTAAAILVSKNKDAVKFGFSLPDGTGIIESVLLISDDRRTACVSSQFGCAMGCTFCATAKLGFIRNLTQAEILGQVIGMNDYLAGQSDKLITNIVFMGMGEALSNFENFRSALDIIMAADGFGIGGRKITVSTVGIGPSIEKLIEADLNIGLAISLNAHTNELRSRYMPANNHYPIETLIASAERYFNKTGRRVTFEYVVIHGENDTPEAIRILGRQFKELTCKFNIIPLNTGGLPLHNSPTIHQVNEFANALEREGLAVTIRSSRGADIDGACGQLAGQYTNK